MESLTAWDPEAGNGEIIRLQRLSPDVLRWSLIGLDVVGVISLAIICYGFYGGAKGFLFEQVVAATGLFLPCWIAATTFTQLYEQTSEIIRRRAVSALSSSLIAFSVMLTLLFGLHTIGNFSRVWMTSWVALSCIWVCLDRVLVFRRIQHALDSRMCFERILIISGRNDAALRFANDVEVESTGQARVVATISRDLHDCLLVVQNWIEQRLIDRIVFLEVPPEDLFGRLSQYSITISVVPALGFEPVRVDNVAGRVAFDLVTEPLSDGHRLAKRVEDVVLALFTLILISPVMIFCAIAVGLDSPGPVFFKQERVGFNGSTFKLFKFRTMYHNMSDQGAVQQTSRGDPRVTRVGRFLRKTSIDELPQLFNVLLGSMSMVGPRPHALSMTAAGMALEKARSDYAARHRVKPGITGWAQINGSRGEVNTVAQLSRRTELDLWYISNASVLLDLRILFRTAAVVLFDSNAY